MLLLTLIFHIFTICCFFFAFYRNSAIPGNRNMILISYSEAGIPANDSHLPDCSSNPLAVYP